jgi:hypothetical protein
LFAKIYDLKRENFSAPLLYSYKPLLYSYKPRFEFSKKTDSFFEILESVQSPKFYASKEEIKFEKRCNKNFCLLQFSKKCTIAQGLWKLAEIKF